MLKLSCLLRNRRRPHVVSNAKRRHGDARTEVDLLFTVGIYHARAFSRDKLYGKTRVGICYVLFIFFL